MNTQVASTQIKKLTLKPKPVMEVKEKVVMKVIPALPVMKQLTPLIKPAAVQPPPTVPTIVKVKPLTLKQKIVAHLITTGVKFNKKSSIRDLYADHYETNKPFFDELNIQFEETSGLETIPEEVVLEEKPIPGFDESLDNYESEVGSELGSESGEEDDDPFSLMLDKLNSLELKVDLITQLLKKFSKGK